MAVLRSIARCKTVLFFAFAAMSAQPAQAVEFVRGGYGVEAVEPTSGAAAPSSAPSSRFATDREGEVWRGAWTASDDVRFAVGALGGFDAPVDARRGDRAFLVGGEMARGEWRFGGAYVRTQFGARELDLVRAGLGYGRLSASLGLGVIEDRDGEVPPSDLMVLSAEIDALPWLEVGGDLSLRSDDRETDPLDAAGRLVFRLEF